MWCTTGPRPIRHPSSWTHSSQQKYPGHCKNNCFSLIFINKKNSVIFQGFNRQLKFAILFHNCIICIIPDVHYSQTVTPLKFNIYQMFFNFCIIRTLSYILFDFQRSSTGTYLFNKFSKNSCNKMFYTMVITIQFYALESRDTELAGLDL